MFGFLFGRGKIFSFSGQSVSVLCARLLPTFWFTYTKGKDTRLLIVDLEHEACLFLLDLFGISTLGTFILTSRSASCSSSYSHPFTGHSISNIQPTRKKIIQRDTNLYSATFSRTRLLFHLLHDIFILLTICHDCSPACLQNLL